MFILSSNLIIPETINSNKLIKVYFLLAFFIGKFENHIYFFNLNV
ncbi:Uncharacterised protein [Sphingobacterium daejeonense]|nr:Uncharacterised protein [Sphingobacterium daejeonense]